jgi:Family of unknown function (DUF6065)
MSVEQGPRRLTAVAFVEAYATSRERCALLQQLFRYRRRLVELGPFWFTQLVSGAMLAPEAEPQATSAHTVFVAMKGGTETWQKTHPELFVGAVVRRRWSVEGRVHVVTHAGALFEEARRLALQLPDAVEVPLTTDKEEGAARATLETRRHELRKGKPLKSSTSAQPPVADAEPDDAPERALEPLGPRSIVAYTLDAKAPMRLRPAEAERRWIEEAEHRFPARCLPLLIANQAGWEIVLDDEVVATWDGRPGVAGVSVKAGEAIAGSAVSHFGLGILTFSLPFLFRTSPGYNVLARGPANRPKPGASPLEGIVETDWTAATFTMNWQLTDVGRPVRFERGEVIAMIVPQRRGELEAFEPRVVPLHEDPELLRRNAVFNQSRGNFLLELRKAGTVANEEQWQRSYFQGRDPDGTEAPEHQTKLRLKPFS